MNEQVIIEVHPISNSQTIKAYADVTIETELGEFTVPGFKICEKDGRKWVFMPDVSKKNGSDEYENVPKILTSRRFKKNITELILQKYEEF